MKNILSTNGTPLTQSSTTTPGGYVPLGVSGKKFTVLSLLDNKVHHLSPSDLKEMELKSVCGALWCDENYSVYDAKKKTSAFNYRWLANDIMAECQALGPYSEQSERGTGVWQLDETRLIVNGSQLWTSDGTVLQHGVHDGRVYPAVGEVEFDMDTELATDGEVRLVSKLFGSLNWVHPMAEAILLAWVFVAVVGPALRRRPHVRVTGPRGCGKSTVLDVLKALLGVLYRGFTTPPTEAGLRQTLAERYCCCAIDEFEYDPTVSHHKAALVLARGAYSMGEEDEGIARGTVSGTPMKFRVTSPMLTAGIQPGQLEAADASRWVVLEAKELARVATTPINPQALAEVRAIGPKLKRLAVSRWGVFQASLVVVQQRIIASGGDSRMADTVGTLLAAYWAMVSAIPATEADADVLVEMYGVKSQVDEHKVSDEEMCLEALTSKVVRFNVTVDDVLVTRQLSIGQAVEAVCKDPTNQPDIVMRLAQMGLRVACVKGSWLLYVANSPVHQELRKVFNGTKWAAGGWSLILRRLPGGEERTQRIGAGFRPSKVTVIPVPQHLLPPEGEDELPLAA